MSEVHKAISSHSQSQHRHIQIFVQLDNQREALIEEALELCKANQPYSVDGINEVTTQINALASKGVSPTRKYVTNTMVKEYAQKLVLNKWGQ
ncbi:YpbS family protein [Cytobacillus sp. Hm23]